MHFPVEPVGNTLWSFTSCYIQAGQYYCALSPFPADECSAIAVSGLIFLTDGTTQNYQDLEKELLMQHECDRIQPVAAHPNSTPLWDSTWGAIASRLKNENENCLVYIIWSGSLETLNGNHDPPIRKVIQSFDRLLHKNTPSKETVNHRLILVQLGSKGTVDELTSHLNTKVFWKESAEDANFNAKECSKHISKVVRRVLLEKHRQAKNSTTKVTVDKSFVDGPANTALKTGRSHDSKLQPGKQDTLTTADSDIIKEKLDTIIVRLDESKKDVIEHVDSVGRQVEYVSDKIDEQNIQSEKELQGEQ